MFGRLIVVVTAVFLFSEIFAGAARYIATIAGASELVYLPKFLLIVAIVCAFIYAIARRRVSFVGAFVGGVLVFLVALGSVAGLGYVCDPLQVAFGVWVIIPIVYGAVFSGSIRSNWRRLLPLFEAGWVFVLTGVIIDWVTDLPWSGYQYLIGSVKVEAAKNWGTIGISLERLAGFSRLSTLAANQLLVLGVILCIYERKALKIVIWVLSLLGILLTTNKGALGAYVIVSGAIFVRRYVSAALAKAIPIGGVILVLAGPVASLLIDFGIRQTIVNPIAMFLFLSLGDRLEWMWPETIDFVLEHGHPVFGRGFGGIGAAQQYLEPELFTPGDNIAVYLYGIFGLPGVLLLVLYAAGISMHKIHDKMDLLVYALGVSIIFRGVVSNTIEGPFLGVFIGVTLMVSLTTFFGQLMRIFEDFINSRARSMDPRNCKK